MTMESVSKTSVLSREARITRHVAPATEGLRFWGVPGSFARHESTANRCSARMSRMSRECLSAVSRDRATCLVCLSLPIGERHARHETAERGDCLLAGSAMEGADTGGGSNGATTPVFRSRSPFLKRLDHLGVLMASTEDEKRAAWASFMAAVHAGKRGDYELAKAIVERVRAKFGDRAADAQRRELWRVIQAGQPKTTEVAK